MNKRTRVVEEISYGVYVWEMPDGRWVGDDEGHYLTLTCKKGDMTKIMPYVDIVKRFIRESGQEIAGGLRFISGSRPVSDEEYEEQQMRARAGLIPDKYDLAALAEERKYSKRND